MRRDACGVAGPQPPATRLRPAARLLVQLATPPDTSAALTVVAGPSFKAVHPRKGAAQLRLPSARWQVRDGRKCSAGAGCG